jgi:hypothetical protein
MITLLAQLLILALVLGVVWWAITLFPLPAPILKILQVIIIVIALIAIIDLLLGISGFGLFRGAYLR